jgi:hypothetical protein
MIKTFNDFLNQPISFEFAAIGVGLTGILIGLFVIFFTKTRND